MDLRSQMVGCIQAVDRIQRVGWEMEVDYYKVSTTSPLQRQRSQVTKM